MHITLLPIDLKAIASAATPSPEVAGVKVLAGAWPPGFVLSAAQQALEGGGDAMWSAPFAFACGVPRAVVGSGGFKGPPSDGRVEIGYGVDETARNRGHASASVAALCRLAFGQPGVREVFAETTEDNLASQRVLQKAGFAKVGRRESAQDGPVLQWLLARRPGPGGGAGQAPRRPR